MELVRAVALPQRLRALLDHARPVEAQPGGWYELRNAAGEGDTDAELTIYSEIGGWFDSVTAASFAAELGQVTAKNLTLRLSSPGGSVFEGIAIANLLRSHPANVTVVVDGIAASIASVIAIAGDTVIMNPQSQFMIHDALTVAIGNAADMREMADLLDRQSDNIAEAYRARAGGRRDTWRNRMRQETWYSAEEAVAAGLADKVAQYPRQAAPAEPDEDAPDMAAKVDVKIWDLSIYRYAGREQAPAPDAADLIDRATDDDTARKTAPVTRPAPAADEPEKVAVGQIVINVTGAADLEALAAVMRRTQTDQQALTAAQSTASADTAGSVGITLDVHAGDVTDPQAIAARVRDLLSDEFIAGCATDAATDAAHRLAAEGDAQPSAGPDETTTRLTFGRRTEKPAARTLAFGRGGTTQ